MGARYGGREDDPTVDPRGEMRPEVFAAGRAPLVALAGAAFLILGPVAVGARSTAAAGLYDPVRVVALLNVQFLNDHADLEPTTNAERVRLASIQSLLKAKLEASGRYKFVSIPADAAAKMAAGPEIGACGGCEFDYGKQLGADYAAWLVVQKVSDLILQYQRVRGRRRGQEIGVCP